jgi:hypothetical protein
MSEINAAGKPVCCRDCGQPLGIIRQDGLNGDYLIQVTCWQTGCLLHGFTLSLNKYLRLTESELEIYRKTTRSYPLKFARAGG